MRRLFLRALVGVVPAMAASKRYPAWDENFHRFLKTVNLFLIDYNDGIWQKKKWEAVENAWKELSPE